jgi:hypothetical protein
MCVTLSLYVILKSVGILPKRNMDFRYFLICVFLQHSDCLFEAPRNMI